GRRAHHLSRPPLLLVYAAQSGRIAARSAHPARPDTPRSRGDRPPARDPLRGDLDPGVPPLRVRREPHAGPGCVRRRRSLHGDLGRRPGHGPYLYHGGAAQRSSGGGHRAANRGPAVRGARPDRGGRTHRRPTLSRGRRAAATRRDVLWQFLVEAATLTLMGGILGIIVGIGTGEFLKRLLDFSTTVPVWSAAIATIVSIGVGLVFGIAPAARAARLDPVEALRYE